MLPISGRKTMPLMLKFWKWFEKIPNISGLIRSLKLLETRLKSMVSPTEKLFKRGPVRHRILIKFMNLWTRIYESKLMSCNLKFKTR